jgi:hypothetical protein
MLRITDMECSCAFTIDEGKRLWLFQVEPKIRGVERGGPSYGKLESGDVIVAIDGMLITTRNTGVRFANLVADEPMALDVCRRAAYAQRQSCQRLHPIPMCCSRSDAAAAWATPISRSAAAGTCGSK